MADNALTKLSLTGQMIAALVVALAIGGGFYFWWAQPKLEEERTKQARLDALRKDIQALEVTAAKLSEFMREVQLLEAKLETLKRILPPEKETPDLMKRVQALAAQSNLSIKKFTPGATVNKEFYQEWPINMSVDGNYHNLGLFFDRVSRLSRLINVGSLKIQTRTASQTATNTLSADCVATTFVYMETPPGAKPAGAPR